MKFSIAREALLKPLNLVAGVVERRQTMPVLSNVLMVLEDGQLSLTGTDLEVELVGRVAVESEAAAGEITVPARKLADICKSLKEGAFIEFDQDEQKVVVKSGRSRFSLSSLPSTEFPNIEESSEGFQFSIAQKDLKLLIQQTSFAMAQQDVRYYLNGMLWEVGATELKVVATDGHRLAMTSYPTDIPVDTVKQVILPRKGVIELARLLEDTDDPIEIMVGSNHLKAVTESFTFTSKLVDGKFPDYERVLPRKSDKLVLGARSDLKEAFNRTAILSNEKYRGVRLNLSNGELQIQANNPEQEEAEDVLAVDYSGDELEIGFNVSYLLDVLSVMNAETVKLSMSDSNSSALLEEVDEESKALYVVMPMRL